MKISTGILLVMMLFVVSCGGGQETIKIDPNKPDWVDRGGGAFQGDASSGSAFYGVGPADAKTHPTTTSRRTAADLNARADLARAFKTNITDLVKAYERVVSDGEMANVEVFSQQATTGFTSVTLVGAAIVDRYYDRYEKTQYSLCRMNVAQFKNQIKQLNNLAEEVEEIILNNAKEAIDELTKMQNQR